MPNSADKYDTLSLVICLELDDGTGHGSDNVVAITVAVDEDDECPVASSGAES